MDYSNYKKLFQTESNTIAIKIMRARNAPLILCFLQESFKGDTYSPTVSDDRLVNLLVDFLEKWGIDEDESTLSELGFSLEDKAVKLIKDWVKEGYLSLYTNDFGQDLHSLTPEIETVLDWIVTLMQKRSFVGQESRFLDIFHKLRELVQNSTDDWKVKIAELEAQKSKIDEKIRELEITKRVEVFEDYQIKDRFREVNIIARSLLRDFREVEGNFQEISRKIYQKQTEQNQNKGHLLGFSLDALDELRSTDQGKSFEAFYQHLTDPQQKKELDQLIRQVFELLKSKEIENEDTFLRKIKSYLHFEGKKVNDSFYQLAKKLEKIIADKNIRERRKSLQLINDIKNIALQLTNDLPKEIYLEIEDRAEYISTDTQVSITEKESKITARILSESVEDDGFSITINPNVVNKVLLESQVLTLLKSHSQVTLQKVVEVYPLKHGLAELMIYGGIAASSIKHLISDTQKTSFILANNRKIEFPEIIFCR